MVAFIDKHRGEYGVEPICDVLPIAPSTYYTQAARREDPQLRPARAKRDEKLRPESSASGMRTWRCTGPTRSGGSSVVRDSKPRAAPSNDS